MKKTSASRSAFFNLRLLVGVAFCSIGLFLALLGSGLLAATEEQQPVPQENSGIQFGQSYKNDVSPALRDLPAYWPPAPPNENGEESREANLNPKLPLPFHVDQPDPVVDHGILGLLAPNAMPPTILNFDGILFPGVSCNCHPPDTNGAIGATQYVQMVNEGYQVFNKTTGASMAGPTGITAIWSGFGGVCQTNGAGDPVVLYDHLANRWLISQFAGTSVPTDQCIAISTTSDATGTYNRYAFHLGSNFFDYPHLAVWPDGYYMSMNVFNSSGTTLLGPQAFAFDRAKMLTGVAATFVTPGVSGSTEPSFLPADLDGPILPTAGVGDPFVSFPGSGTYKVRLFHADFVTPANTTFTLIGSPAAAAFTALCPSTRACVPQLTPQASLDGIGDRLMFRLAYRKFGDGHEAVVGNYTVSSGGVAGIRWFELRAVTTAPTVFQQSTYQPDATWRWMGSTAMDQNGDLAIGFSASSSTIHPDVRYAGRLAGDPINTLAQGEATIIAGAGSQGSGNGNRWGDYSAMTVDPVDDCTFWYTQEYYSTNGGNWRTRIANFKFSSCTAGPTPTPTATPTPSPTPTPSATPTPPPTPTPTPTPSPTPTPTPTPSGITVSLPIDTFDTSVPIGNVIIEPVLTTNLNASQNIDAFQGDFLFDSAVIDFDTATAPVQPAGMTATQWNVSGAVMNSGPGTIRTLRVSAFATGTNVLSGSGTLYELRMVRVSNTPGASSTMNWQPPPDDFEYFDLDFNTITPAQTNGNITIVAGTSSISGNMTYCNPGPVAGALMTLTGTSGGSTTTDGSGNYSFVGLASSGSYTVTPTKADRAPGSAGIDTLDVIAVQKHFLGSTLIPPGCRLTAANVSPPAAINTLDVIAIQHFFLGQTFGTGTTGKYQFSPANYTYGPLGSNQTGQNFDALIFGDVAGPFVSPPRPGGPAPDAAGGDEVPSTVAAVTLPEVAFDQSKTNFVAPVTTSMIEAKDQLIGFQGDFTFDERAVTFDPSEPVRPAGLTANNWNVSGNVLPGVGPIRTLRISAYSNSLTPLSGNGTLFELRMRTVSDSALRTPPSVFPMLWSAPPDNFIFINNDLKTQKPGHAGPGGVVLSAAKR